MIRIRWRDQWYVSFFVVLIFFFGWIFFVARIFFLGTTSFFLAHIYLNWFSLYFSGLISFNLAMEGITAIIAGSVVSLLYSFVINNPSCQIGGECQTFERETSESDMTSSNSSTTASSSVVTNTSSHGTHTPHTHITT